MIKFCCIVILFSHFGQGHPVRIFVVKHWINIIHQRRVNHDLCPNFNVFWAAVDIPSTREKWFSKYVQSMWSLTTILQTLISLGGCMTSFDFSIHVLFFFFIQNVRKCKVSLLFMLSNAEPEIVPFVYIIELVDVNRSVFIEKKVAVEAGNWFVFQNLMNFEIVAVLFKS